MTSLNFTEIEGLDLRTDQAVHEICMASNATSSSTRSVLYVLVVVNILAFITVINTWSKNWTDGRISRWEADFRTLPNIINSTTDTIRANNLRDSLRLDSLQWSQYKKFDIENYQNIRIPVVGNTFDVNSLGFVSGLTFLILLIIARFTLGRELVNLKLALNAITKRYPDFANQQDFEGKSAGYAWPDIMPSINRVRRLHHYNSLSMNEIFTFPPLEISKNKIQKGFAGKLVMYIFCFPLVVYASIVINDFETIGKAKAISGDWVYMFLGLNIFYWVLITLLCLTCTRLKFKIAKQYKRFIKNDYKYISGKKENMPRVPA